MSLWLCCQVQRRRLERLESYVYEQTADHGLSYVIIWTKAMSYKKQHKMKYYDEEWHRRYLCYLLSRKRKKSIFVIVDVCHTPLIVNIPSH